MTKKIYFATQNKGKYESVKELLAKYNIEVLHAQIDLPEPRSDDLKVIAKSKALHAFEQLKKPCIVIDSGFYIHSLNGFPKAFVNLALETIGVKGILKLVKGLSRKCEFRNCLAYYDKELDEPKYFESPTRGTLLQRPVKPKRVFWGKLHTIFLPENSKKTFAQMTEKEIEEWQEKNKGEEFADNFAKWFLAR